MIGSESIPKPSEHITISIDFSLMTLWTAGKALLPAAGWWAWLSLILLWDQANWDMLLLW